MFKLSGADLVNKLKDKYPDIAELENRFDTMIEISPGILTDFMSDLKKNYGFNYLADMTAVDNKTSFTVVYRAHSIPDNRQLVVKVSLDRDNAVLPTINSIWGAADWQERELYDLMGINFTGRSITRILLPEEFAGHPLRKDYTGGRQA